MTRTARYLVLGFLLMAGCVASLQPLYTGDDVVFDPALIGTWTSGGKAVTFAQDGNDKQYAVAFTDEKGNEGDFVVHLVKLGSSQFLDIFPAEPKLYQNDFYKGHLLGTHSFMRIDQISPTLKIADMDLDWMKQYLTDHLDGLKHETQDQGFVVTASTADLQSFVLAHLQDGCFAPAMEFTRQSAPTTQP